MTASRSFHWTQPPNQGMNSAMDTHVQTLESYGADPAALRLFDKDGGPELLPYLTLTAARQKGDANLVAVIGVYEWQGDPLVVLVDGDRLDGDQDRLRRIRRLVAMRGDAPYLGVVRPGELILYTVALDKATDRKALIKDSTEQDRKTTFARLGNTRPGADAARRRWISDVILDLLDNAIEHLKTRSGLSGDDAISLVGRALFTRFLGDRNLLPPSEFGSPQDIARLFADRDRAAKTSIWLDKTFNGDFLPLSAKDLFDHLPDSAFDVLSDIMYRAQGGQFSLGWDKKWADLHFEHIPIGVFSQAYEHYQRKHDTDNQKKNGGFYTPRAIAELMTRGAFSALRADGDVYRARVLDPAAGAGAFLLTAFRQLVGERWRHDGKRPDTETLRDILYNQITGFDINEAALRFAALALYLLSIELDPEPEPVAKLRFDKDLRGTVLFKVGGDKTEDGEAKNGEVIRDLGSLGDKIGPEHVGRYDLVIGNPPWPTGTKLPNWEVVKETVARIARERNPNGPTHSLLPNECLDLPFLWRAMEWARPQGQIAFALHARLLFQQGDGMPEARRAIFGALDITGIINGAEVRQTKVWPEVSAPFCLVFARNHPPGPASGFRFVTPHLENELNAAGGLRIDAVNADLVASAHVVRRPELLKLLFRGGPLDMELYDRMAARNLPTLAEHWERCFGREGRCLKYSGNGYQAVRNSSKKYNDDLPGKPADFLNQLSELTLESIVSVLMDATKLNNLKLKRVHRRRSPEIYKATLLIVHESPLAHRQRIGVAVAEQDVRYDESFYGYSTRHHAEGGLLARYLALVIGSKPALWHALVTSGKFGFEREVVEKFVVEQIRLPWLDDLDPADRDRITPLFDALVEYPGESAWEQVDAWVAQLYGLRPRDLRIIADTLNHNLPFAENRQAAQRPATGGEVATFCATLAAELQPFAQHPVAAAPVMVPPGMPWRVAQVTVGTPATTVPSLQPADDWWKVFQLAHQMAATQVVHAQPELGCLWLARLDQARYWSHSQARLVARRILWEQIDVLMGREE